MKIGFLNLLYAKPAQRGGLGSHILTLSRELARMGHEVTVITSGTGDPWIEQGVQILPVGSVERYERPSQLASPSYVGSRLTYMWRAAQLIRASGLDIIEAADGGIEHLFLLSHRTCPIVVKLHGSFQHIYRPPAGLSSVMLRLERIALRRSDALYTSTAAYARAAAHAYRVPVERIRVIPYGIDLREIDAVCGARPVDYPADLAGMRVVLLSVGSSIERKGAPIFIETARQFHDPDVRFVPVCSDPAALRRFVLPPNLVVLSHLERRDFYALVAASSVVVLPSEFESFSIATYEAMLLGRNVVVSRQVPLESPALEYPRRITLDRITATDLASAVRRFLDQSGELPALEARDIPRLREAHSIERVAEQTVEFFQQVAVGYAHSPVGSVG